MSTDTELPSALIEGVKACLSNHSRMAFFIAVMKVVDQKIEFKRLKRTCGESKQEYENCKRLERNKRKRLRRQLKCQEGKQAAVAARKKIKSLGELHTVNWDLSGPLEKVLEPFKLASIFSWRKTFNDCKEIRIVESIGHVLKPNQSHRRDFFTITILVDQQLFKNWHIQILNKDETWEDFLTIKESTLPGAGLGVFAAQNFPSGTIIGAYLGGVRAETGRMKNNGHRFKYTLRVLVEDKWLVIDPTLNDSGMNA